MVKSPSCWIDPFQMKPDRRRTTKLTRTAEPMSRDVIELKQAALWHGGKIRTDQVCEVAAEGMVRHFESHFDQKRLDHYPALIKSTQNHCRLHIQHLSYHRRPQWNCIT